MIVLLNKQELLNTNGGRKAFTDSSPEEIGFVVGRWLGDLVMAIGAIRGLKK